MNNMKRIAACVFMAAATLLAVSGIDAASAKAESLTNKATVLVDYETQVISVVGLSSDDKEVLVNFPTVKTDRDGEIIKVTEKDWDVYEAPKAEDATAKPKITIDISILNPAKRNYVILKSLKCEEPILICIEPVLSSVKGSYDAEEKIVTFTAGEEELYADEFQYRTTYGSWVDYNDEVSLEMYEHQGATLYFRQKPGAVEQVKKPKANGIPYGKGDGEYLEYDANAAFGSKEIKVKVTALKTAPKVTKVDLDNQAYVLKKGLEYRFSNNADRDWTSVSGTTVVRLADELDAGNIYYDGQFEVRYQEVPASGRKAYTAPSRIRVYEYPGLRTIETLSQKAGVSLLEALPINELTRKQELNVTQYKDNKGKVAGVEIENLSDMPYQIAVSPTQIGVDAVSSNTKIKPKVIKSGAKLKLANSKSACPEGSYIYVRYAANKTTGDWASSYVSLGKLTYQ